VAAIDKVEHAKLNSLMFKVISNNLFIFPIRGQQEYGDDYLYNLRLEFIFRCKCKCITSGSMLIKFIP